ncbi:MAG: DNA damage-inducible protein D [Brevundimonas sp.]|uniref:DNA damage-inducible protein D n=1 Tax=Brevundimonas sp. TaxID=1871086 RepID=UPI002716D094|nr:DNA damage-inducible protein D [Brevundimonas sp.]MDO9588027.1 DNA damage-inducible protein D [Brevundimonas sp.]MDP3656668.1 DNA damage-inducible protein D [Brevundimonas sp.]MDZ4111662.1 DNA damage-inducible protein D [Brevundimonas sp.]
MAETVESDQRTFESIRRESEGAEYWLARQLAPLLDYQNYRNFLAVVEKAKIACATGGLAPADHFVDIDTMVDIGSGARRAVADVRLSRYACYLIVQNGDPTKPVIAQGQTYFAVQTRRQEIQDDSAFTSLSEDERRLMLRREMAHHNTSLASAASQAGVTTGLDYAVFQDHGYRGLYGGRTMRDIHAHKGLKKSQKILDHMGSTELAANLFRATQTEEKLKRDGARTRAQANDIHMAVGKKVRATIGELGGVMPEHLPTPDTSIQQLERRQTRAVKDEREDG